MNIITITDANNKEFSIDMNKVITYINDDLSSDANKLFGATDTNIEVTPIEVKIVNSKDEAIDMSIMDSSSPETEIVDIDVYIEATHSDNEINSAYYTSDSMLRDATSYTSPYKKPFILNHDTRNEPIGRIIQSDCIDSATVEGAKAINVVARVSDKDAIDKFIDGRYSTVSIGANPKTITCNHCGKHILKDEKFKFCGHFRGETYDNKKCTWKMEDLEYSELSVVNCPADKMAQVYKIKVNTKADLRTNNSNDNSLASQIINAAVKDLDTTVLEDPDSKLKVVDLGADDLEVGVVADANYVEDLKSCQEKLDEVIEEARLLRVDNSFLTDEIEKISNLFISSLKKAIDKCGKELSEDTKFEDILSLYNESINNIDVKTSNVVVGANGIKSSVVSNTSKKSPTIVTNVADITLNNPNDPNVIPNTEDELAKNKTGDNTNKSKDVLATFFNKYN